MNLSYSPWTRATLFHCLHVRHNACEMPPTPSLTIAVLHCDEECTKPEEGTKLGVCLSLGLSVAFGVCTISRNPDHFRTNYNANDF